MKKWLIRKIKKLEIFKLLNKRKISELSKKHNSVEKIEFDTKSITSEGKKSREFYFKIEKKK